MYTSCTHYGRGEGKAHTDELKIPFKETTLLCARREHKESVCGDPNEAMGQFRVCSPSDHLSGGDTGAFAQGHLLVARWPLHVNSRGAASGGHRVRKRKKKQ